MPIRKPHNKSRYGCDQCRKRRVKCDEKPPRCSNCINRNELCQFSRIPPAKRRTATPQATPLATPSPSYASTCGNVDVDDGGTPNVRPDLDWPSESIRARELTLMHQWCCYTYECASREWHRLFKEWVGKQAIHCDYLMAAVFAFSSFHLAANALEEPSVFPAVRKHVSIGLEYQDRALNGLQAALRTITTENAPCVLFTSILVAACAVISSILPAGPQDQTRSAALGLLPLVDHIKSIEFVKRETVPLMKGGSVAPYVDRNYQSLKTNHNLCVGELRRLNGFTLPEFRDVYENAIANLERLAQTDDSITDWIGDVGSEYLGGLRREESMAVAIYMHWGVLLDKLRGNWWAKFVGRRLVAELSDKLEGRGPEWRPIQVWCRNEVGLPVTSANSSS